MKIDKKQIWTLVLVFAFGLFGGYVFGSRDNEVGVVGRNYEDMHGMISDMATMGLEGKHGATFEKAFIDEMIEHHKGAISMAELLLKETERPELRKLGREIISAQSAEIEAMQSWREDWF